MIYGIGVDIIKVDRLRAAVERWGERFLRRVFADSEIAYCYAKKDPFPSLSARFAAKEALIKAMGSRMAVPFTDMEVANNPHGKPFMKVSGKLEKFFRDNSLQRIHLSLSHERDYGIAFVIIEKESE